MKIVLGRKGYPKGLVVDNDFVGTLTATEL